MESGRKEKNDMAKGVSSKTHTQKQLDDYANQNNPNNKAYRARIANSNKVNKARNDKKAAIKSAKHQCFLEEKTGVLYPLDPMCYSNPYDME
jgi:hypothetical protein